MRITFVNRYFFPDISATSQLLTELAEDLDARGESVTVITGNSSYVTAERLPTHATHRGIRIERVGFTRFGRSSLLGRLADYLSFWIGAFWTAVRLKDQDCLVVLSDPPMLSLFAATVRFFDPVTTVCWLQDVFPDIAVRAGVIGEGLAARLLRRVGMWSLRQMDRVVVIGHCMEQRLLSCGLPANKLAVIPNWADGTQIGTVPHQDTVFARQHGLQNKFVVMYSGNHGIVHEVETLVGLIRATASTPDILFCFIGEGAWKQRLMSISQAERWAHVMFLPYQPKTSLEDSLSAADVHLVSLREGMQGLCVPSKLYGVLAAGRPVLFVGPSESEVARVIREADCGFSVPPGDVAGAQDALFALYHDRALRERQGRAARKYFQWNCDRVLSTERFRQLFHRVCEQPVGGRQWAVGGKTVVGSPELVGSDQEAVEGGQLSVASKTVGGGR